MKMNQRIKRLWVEALRSGEYEQGKHKLVTESLAPNEPDAFCCLGVLTNIYVEETGDSSGGWGCSDRAFLTDRVAEWAKTDTDPKPDEEPDNLAGMNDCGSTFEEIASIIEKYL